MVELGQRLDQLPEETPIAEPCLGGFTLPVRLRFAGCEREVLASPLPEVSARPLLPVFANGSVVLGAVVEPVPVAFVPVPVLDPAAEPVPVEPVPVPVPVLAPVEPVLVPVLEPVEPVPVGSVPVVPGAVPVPVVVPVPVPVPVVELPPVGVQVVAPPVAGVEVDVEAPGATTVVATAGPVTSPVPVPVPASGTAHVVEPVPVHVVEPGVAVQAPVGSVVETVPVVPEVGGW